MEIALIAFALSVPVFYIWGFVAFIQKYFGNKNKPPSYTPYGSRSYGMEKERKELIEYLYERAEEAPDLPLGEFVEEVRERRRQVVAERMTVRDEVVSEIEPASSFEREPAPAFETEPARLSDMVSEPVHYQPEKRFSWSEWYSDHTIDFILYLGAFMIVAAVSLFVGIQWENFNGITRFGIVAAFTASWFVAGIGVQRFLSLEGVTIAFMTIGAIITPFCGVAYQRFVIDSMENVGIVWLITSIIGTGIYLVLSLYYQRRHFTYFGNLSILATVLSLVEVTASPAEFYVLAGTVTAIILLAARVAVKMLAPRLDAYLGQDVEHSSLAILGFSVVAGITLIPMTGLAFFSIEVLAVMVATLIFACLYLTLYFNRYTVLIAQTLGVLTFSHALLTFNIDERIALYTVIVFSIALQFVLNRLLADRHPEIHAASNVAGLLVTGIGYLLGIAVAEGGFIVPAIVLLMGHAAYYAIRFEKYAWYLVSILSYALLAHILVEMRYAAMYWTLPYVILSVAQMVAIRLPVAKVIREAFVYPALIVAGIAGAWTFSELDRQFISDSLQWMLIALNPFIVLVAYSLTMLADKTREEPLFESPMAVLLATVSGVYFVISVQLVPPVMPIFLALSISVMFWIAYRTTGIAQLFYVIFAAPYAALIYTLMYFDAAYEVYPIAVAILSVITYFALFLPEDSDIPRQIVAILAAIAVSVFALSQAIFAESMTMHFAGWVSSYTALFMLWKSRTLIGEEAGDVLISVAVYLQYVWHIIFLQLHVDAVLFDNPQWYSAALASVMLINMFNIMRRNADSEFIFPLHLGFVAVLMIPTLGQANYDEPLLYLGLSVFYSLIVVGIGTMFRRTSLDSQAITVLAPIAVSFVAFGQAIINESMIIHFVGWLSAYASLYLLWNLRNLIGEETGDAVFSVALYLQYVWHIIFLQLFVNEAIFSDPQWYSAALATGLFVNMIKRIRRSTDGNNEYLFPLQLIAVAVLMTSTLGQIVYEQSLLYFGLGVVYSLAIAAIAITFSQSRLRILASVSLVLVVLSQSSEFLLNLPRWVVVGVIGFGLLGAGLYLSIRRRNVKKEVQDI